ncbi:unnamed protein product [Brugia timori]|uniref:NR LBD domain-containing protein n=1 Tax=Brugia timori TaxID=42155 RepID=A0A0R3QND2_9BILA|nr:unnamed protein product [Brugia timori]
MGHKSSRQKCESEFMLLLLYDITIAKGQNITTNINAYVNLLVVKERSRKLISSFDQIEILSKMHSRMSRLRRSLSRGSLFNGLSKSQLSLVDLPTLHQQSVLIGKFSSIINPRIERKPSLGYTTLVISSWSIPASNIKPEFNRQKMENFFMLLSKLVWNSEEIFLKSD